MFTFVCRYELANGDVYEGQWLKGKKNGFGSYTSADPNAPVYEGEWKMNKRHGSGKLISRDGAVLEEGIW